MNNKIRASEVACLIDGSEAYDKVYNSLKVVLPSDEEMIFAERESGHGFLQWNLPDEGWTSLDKGDALQTLEVKKALEQRMRHVKAKFGDNLQMAEKVLTFPDDSYVFFKYDVSGKLIILLTAWGYRHPIKIDGGFADGRFTPSQLKEPVSITILYDGKPLGEKPFRLNSMVKQTDADGSFVVGDLPLGYQFDLEVDDNIQHVVVAEGKGHIVVDATVFTMLEVTATKDDQPYGDVPVAVCYGDQQLQIVTDMQGRATVQVPMSLDGQECKVTINGETQSKPLSGPITLFSFDFLTQSEPEPAIIPEPVPTSSPQPEPVSEPIPEPIPEPTPEQERGGVWGALLLGLALALLVAGTYLFGSYILY